MQHAHCLVGGHNRGHRPGCRGLHHELGQPIQTHAGILDGWAIFRQQDVMSGMIEGLERQPSCMGTCPWMATFSKADVDEYVRAYSSLGSTRGMLGYYRAVIEDMEYNQRLFETKISVPVLALGGDVGSAPGIFEAMKPLVENIQGGVIANSGHYIPEEQPEALVSALQEFFFSIQAR